MTVSYDFAYNWYSGSSWEGIYDYIKGSDSLQPNFLAVLFNSLIFLATLSMGWFDIIPAKYITGIICEQGIIKPKDIGKIIKKSYPFLLK